jgi:hypothetical protein
MTTLPATSPHKPIRIALVGGLNIEHARVFARMFNKQLRDPEAKRRLQEAGFPPMPADAVVETAWDEDYDKALALAKEFDIPQPCRSLDAALSQADAAIICDDAQMTHQRWALPVMQSGLPYFHDKPFAPSYREAAEIIEQAKSHHAIMFSSSALAFARELEELAPQLAQEGGVSLAVACGPVGQLLFYGIHPFTAIYTLFGPGVRTVQVGGPAGRHSARVEWHDGRTGMLVVDARVKGFTLILHTAKSCHLVRITDSAYFYYNTMRKFVEMVLTQRVPIPWEHTLEIIKVLDTAGAAARRGDHAVIEV